jgi:hypothetical protein
MTMRSPIVAMLWENWRLTRVEAAHRLGLGIVAGSAALVLFDAGATVAFWILIAQHGLFYMSIAKLNGGRFMDGYKPGFPFYLLYTRPVPTVVFVGVAMAYDALSCAALYLASAALLGFAFDQPLPLFSVAVWIVAAHLSSIAYQWSTRSKVVQWLASIAVTSPFILLLMNRMTPPLQVEFSLAENALMALTGIVAFAITAAAVARQRRGGAVATVARTAGSAGYPDWLITLFRFPCPTSSATRAQVWFELKSSGLPVLAIGLALAIVIPPLFWVIARIDVVLSELYSRPAALGVVAVVATNRAAATLVAMFSLLAVLMLGGNAFGIRARQGRTYASAFEVTQACGTARMAGLKVLVRSVCLLAALLAVGTSVWTSASVLPLDVLDDSDTRIKTSPSPLGGLMRAIRGGVGAMSAHEMLALAFVTVIVVAVMVACRAALPALRARYPRRLSIAKSLLLLHGFVLVLVALAGQRGIGSETLTDALFGMTRWVATAAIALATVCLLWKVLAERVLTLRYACGALVTSAAFGAAWVTVLHAVGVQLAGMPATDAVWALSPLLLPLMASALAPWSLSRIRHM